MARRMRPRSRNWWPGARFRPTNCWTAALAAVARLNPALNAVVLMQEDVARRVHCRGPAAGAVPRRAVPDEGSGLRGGGFPVAQRLAPAAPTPATPAIRAIFERIRATGVVTFGRTTSPEGGIGAATEAAVYGGPTRNPWNLDHTSGGSSGGAGAAVAAGIVAFAHGSDGGGSVRIPASSCGLFGFKPTRARLPDGPYAGEGWAGMAIDGFLTQFGARHRGDAGRLRRAPTWARPTGRRRCGRSHADAISRPPRRLRVAICDTTLTGEPIHPECRDAVLAAARLLEDLGHHVEPGRPKADVPMMMRAWTDIVAVRHRAWRSAGAEGRGR